jgi:hypothetical protein
MDPVAALPQGHGVTVGHLLRRRRAVRDRAEALAANDALFDAARDFRRRAQVQLNAGHPELARPFLDEAELFESAAQRVPGL